MAVSQFPPHSPPNASAWEVSPDGWQELGPERALARVFPAARQDRALGAGSQSAGSLPPGSQLEPFSTQTQGPQIPAGKVPFLQGEPLAVRQPTTKQEAPGRTVAPIPCSHG